MIDGAPVDLLITATQKSSIYAFNQGRKPWASSVYLHCICMTTAHAVSKWWWRSHCGCGREGQSPVHATPM